MLTVIHLGQPHEHTGIVHVMICDVVERGIGGEQLRSLLEAANVNGWRFAVTRG
jgi:hypothetical protein